MLAIIERRGVFSNQAQPGFVHERGRLKRLPGSFAGELGCRESPELVVNEYKQFLGGFRVACLDGS